MRGVAVEAQPGSEILAEGVRSYFDRSYRHFCSHRQTPSSGLAGPPAIVRNGQAIYFAHPIFAQYNQNAPLWCKVLFLNALEMLLPEPLVRHEGPTTLRTTINEQPGEERWIVHLLHYIPERRGQEFDVIEDVIPLYEIKASIKTPQVVQAVTRVPQQEVLAFEQKGKRVEFILPELVGHQMVVLSF